jgi:hypothetical protein
MATQQPFLDLGEDKVISRKTDPETSKQATKIIKTATLRRLILDILASFPNGLITAEIARYCGRQRDSISPHLVPLRTLGYVVKTGKLKANPKTGMTCEIWKVTEKYWEARRQLGANSDIDWTSIRRQIIIDLTKEMRDIQSNIWEVAKLQHPQFNPQTQIIFMTACNPSPLGLCIKDKRMYMQQENCKFCGRK